MSDCQLCTAVATLASALLQPRNASTCGIHNFNCVVGVQPCCHTGLQTNAVAQKNQRLLLTSFAYAVRSLLANDTTHYP